MAKIKTDMTRGAILPLLVRFTIPIMLTSLIHQLFNTADTVVVGRWGGETALDREIAISAVGASAPLISFLITLLMGLSIGASVVVSHDVGAKQFGKIEKTVHTAVATATLCGLFLAAVGIVFARPLLRLLDTPDAVIEPAVLYMRAYFCGIPAQMIYNYCAGMLRSTGDSTRPLIFLSVSGVVNVLMNLVMVLGLRQGALGVGIATAVSQWVSCFLVLGYMMKDDGLCHVDWKKLRIDPVILRHILAIGLPAGIQQSMFSIGNVVMQSALNSFNNTVYVSGSSIASSVGIYPQLICGSFGQATQVFVGQNTGAKNAERIRSGVRISILAAVLSSIAINAVMNLFSVPLLSLFAPGNTEVIAFARVKLLVNSSFYFLAHWGDLYAVSLRGMGKSTLPMIVSIAGICGVRIMWIYTVFAFFREPIVIFAAYGVSWLVTCVAQGILYGRTVKRAAREWTAEE